MDPIITKLLFKFFIFAILGIIVYKLLTLSHGISKFFHGLYKGLTPPLKKIFLWQYRNFQIIGKNLIYTKKDLYSSLKNTEYVGTITEINTHKVLTNPIFKALLETALIVIFISSIIYTREITEELTFISKSTLTACIGCFIGFLAYKILKKEIPTDRQNKFLKSTLKSIGDELVIKNMLTDAEIKVLLAIPDYSQKDLNRNVKINFSEKKVKYELIYKYWVILIAEKERTQRLLHQNLPNHVFYENKNHSICVYMNAFREIFTYLHQNKNVKAAPVQSGHGGVSLYEHTLWVVEHSIAFLIHEFFGIEREILIAPLVLAALSHDIGKILCFKNDEKADFEGHELLSGNIFGVLSECSELDNQTFNNVIHIIKNQKASLNDEQPENVRIIHRILQGADTMASEQEGASIDRNIIRSMYRKAFMDLFKDINKLETFTCLINTYLFIDIDKFVPEMIKNTGQKYTIKNAITSQAYKDILDFFTADLMLTDKFGEKINCVEFIYRSTNKTARIFKNCLILSLDYITHNKDYYDTFYVGLMKNNDPQQIARLNINSNGLSITDKIDRITYDEEEIFKTNQQLVNKAKRNYNSKTNINFVNNDPNFENMLKQKPADEHIFIDTNKLMSGEISAEGDIILDENSTHQAIVQDNFEAEYNDSQINEPIISSFKTNNDNSINIKELETEKNAIKQKTQEITQEITKSNDDFRFELIEDDNTTESIPVKTNKKNDSFSDGNTELFVNKQKKQVTTVDALNKDRHKQSKNRSNNESNDFAQSDPFRQIKSKSKYEKPMESMKLAQLDKLIQTQTGKGIKPTINFDEQLEFRADKKYDNIEQTTSDEGNFDHSYYTTEKIDKEDGSNHYSHNMNNDMMATPFESKPKTEPNKEIIRKSTSLTGGLKEAEEIIWNYFTQYHIGGINKINWDMEPDSSAGPFMPCKYDGEDEFVQIESYKVRFRASDASPILMWYQSENGEKATLEKQPIKGVNFQKTFDELKERKIKEKEFLLKETKIKQQEAGNLALCKEIYASMNSNVDNDCIYTESVNIPKSFYEKNVHPLCFLRYFTMPENKSITSMNIALINMHVDKHYFELKELDSSLLSENEFFTGYTNIVNDNLITKYCLSSYTKYNYSIINFNKKNKVTILTEKLADGLSILYLNNNVNILYLTNIKDIIANESFRNKYLIDTEIFLSADLLKNKYTFYKEIMNTYQDVNIIYLNSLFEILNKIYIENYNDELSQYRLIIKNLYTNNNFKEESIKLGNLLMVKNADVDRIPLLEAYNQSMNELKMKFNNMVAEGVTSKGKSSD